MKKGINFMFVSLILFLSLVGVFLFHNKGLASELTVPFPDISGGAPPSSVSGPAEYIQTVYKYSVGVGIFLAMLMIVVGAIRYTISEAVSSKGDAKDQITSAIWGLILLLGAFLIFTTIDPRFESLSDPVLEAPADVPEPPQPEPIPGAISNLRFDGTTLSWSYDGTATRFLVEFYEPDFGVWRGFGTANGQSFALPSGTIYAGRQVQIRVIPILGSRFAGSRDSANTSDPITITMPPR